MRIRLLDRKLLRELLKDAKRSDRELSKKLGVSQPTVSRRRVQLEKELSDGYTIVPKWNKLGYEIMAITLVKSKSVLASKEKYESIRKKGLEWLMKQPNIIMSSGCSGLGFNVFNLSLHRNYSDYDEFTRNFKLEWGDAIEEIESIIINLAGPEVLKPLNLKYLAETIE